MGVSAKSMAMHIFVCSRRRFQCMLSRNYELVYNNIYCCGYALPNIFILEVYGLESYQATGYMSAPILI